MWFGEKKEFGKVEEQEHLLLPYWNDLRGINLGYYSHVGDKIYVSIETASNVLFSEFKRGKGKENQILKLPFNERLLKWFILTKWPSN